MLFLSHYVIDSYVPALLWAKYLRCAPQFEGARTRKVMKPWADKEVDCITYATDVDAFKAFASTPLGLVMMITVDQLFHIAFLLPVAWLMMHA